MDTKKITAVLNVLGNLLGNTAIVALVPDDYKFYVLAAANAIHALLAYLANPTGEVVGKVLGRK